MPIYEYHCTSCGLRKEFLQKVTDPVMSVCPECKKQTFSKMLTAAGFHLKGSGWYETDFKGDSEKKRNLVGDKSEPSEPVKSDEKKEAAAVTASDKPKSADKGAAAGTGASGNRHALAPRYGCGSGTCCCHAVMPTIIW